MKDIYVKNPDKLKKEIGDLVLKNIKFNVNLDSGNIDFNINLTEKEQKEILVLVAKYLNQNFCVNEKLIQFIREIQCRNKVINSK